MNITLPDSTMKEEESPHNHITDHDMTTEFFDKPLPGYQDQNAQESHGDQV